MGQFLVARRLGRLLVIGAGGDELAGLQRVQLVGDGVQVYVVHYGDRRRKSSDPWGRGRHMLELPPFTVTPQAVEQIERVGGSVRVDVVEGGCCGQAYAYATEAPAPGDRRYGCPGAWLVVSAAAARVLTGARLDYGATLKPPRFRVTGNPNTAERCPCNRSFGAPWPGRGQPQCQARTPMPWDRGVVDPAPGRN